MNLLQIKQKMLEKAVSESYMADACGVSKLYLHNAVEGIIPMTNKLLQKIENVFKTLEAGKLASGNAKKVNEEKLSEEVKKLRTRKALSGITFKEIADVSGYNSDYVYQIMSGRHKPSQKTINKLVEAFDKIEKGLVIEVNAMPMSDQVVVTEEITDGRCVSDNGGNLVNAEKHFTTEKPDDKKMVLKGRLIGIREARNIVKSEIYDGMPYSDFINITKIILKFDDEIDDLVNQIVDGLK